MNGDHFPSSMGAPVHQMVPSGQKPKTGQPQRGSFRRDGAKTVNTKKINIEKY
jgi:hypothetical protein